MRLSSADQEILRSQPQSTNLYLSIFQPKIIFQAQINRPNAARNDRIIQYDNVVTGTYTNIENGMTLWVGSTQGGNDIGKIRVRSATSGQVVVSENSNIEWQDNQFLTIFKLWELWPVFPRIASDETHANNVIFYKDYDLVYTNQNSILGTFICAGPHRAAFLDPASGQAQIYYTATGSYDLLSGNTPTACSWTFEGGSPSTSNQITPGYVTYNTPGQYVTKLVISGSQGGVDTTYRYVSVYPNESATIQKWALQDMRGSRDEGGYTASLKVFSTIPIQQNAVVVIFQRSQYGNISQNFGGSIPNTSDIFFVGYVDKDSISYDYEHSEVSFEAVSITNIMKKSAGFSVSVASKASPAYWYELLDMDGKRALYHYLRWHTTVLLFNDLQFIGNDYKIQYFDSDRESMYDAINNYMRDALIGQVVSDRQGKIWTEVQAMAYQNPTGTFVPYMDITKRDWVGTPMIEERLNPEIAYAEYGGVAYSGVGTGTFAALIGSAPGDAPGFYGGIDNHEGLALLDQNQLNYLVGNVVGNKNAPYPTISQDMANTVTNMDIAPQEVFGLHIAKEDTVRNLAIDGLYIPDSMSWKYDPKGFRLSANVDFKQLVNGLPGQTVVIPATPENSIGAGYTVPVFSTPPLPTLTFPTTSTPSIIQRLLVHDKATGGGGLFYTENFDKPSVSWATINSGLLAAQYEVANKVCVCANGAIYMATVGDGFGTDLYIVRAAYPGAIFQNVINNATLNDIFGIGSSPKIHFIEADPSGVDEVIFLAGNSNGYAFFKGSGATFVQVPAMHSLLSSAVGSVSFGGDGSNLWMLTDIDGNIKVFPPTYDSITVRSPGLGFGNPFHVRAGITGKTIHPYGTINLRLATGNYTTYIDAAPPAGTTLSYTADPIRFEYLMSSDNLRQYILTEGSNGNTPIVSIDGGLSFFPVAGLPAGSPRKYTFVHGFTDGAESEWVASPSNAIYYNATGASGAWYDKTSNMIAVSPNLAVNAMVVVG